MLSSIVFKKTFWTNNYMSGRGDEVASNQFPTSYQKISIWAFLNIGSDFTVPHIKQLILPKKTPPPISGFNPPTCNTYPNTILTTTSIKISTNWIVWVHAHPHVWSLVQLIIVKYAYIISYFYRRVSLRLHFHPSYLVKEHTKSRCVDH